MTPSSTDSTQHTSLPVEALSEPLDAPPSYSSLFSSPSPPHPGEPSSSSLPSSTSPLSAETLPARAADHHSAGVPFSGEPTFPHASGLYDLATRTSSTETVHFPGPPSSNEGEEDPPEYSPRYSVIRSPGSESLPASQDELHLDGPSPFADYEQLLNTASTMEYDVERDDETDEERSDREDTLFLCFVMGIMVLLVGFFVIFMIALAIIFAALLKALFTGAYRILS